MAMYKLRHFSKPETLKRISPRYLIRFLSPHRLFFQKRAVNLPMSPDLDETHFEALAEVFMNPGPDMPHDLIDALYYVDELSDPSDMDHLMEAASQWNMDLDTDSDSTPMDVAIQIWIQQPVVLERLHAERYLYRPRSFEYYQSEQDTPASCDPSEDQILALEKDMDKWFDKKKRGTGCRVFCYPKDSEVWFSVRHGEPFKREGSIENGESSSVSYRPEKYDVVVYNAVLGEIRINAASKGEKQLYRTAFAKHLFGDSNYFPGIAKYTLDPLTTDGPLSLECADVNGIDWILLKEIHIYWGGSHHEIETRRADDLFKAISERGGSLPDEARKTRAKFKVKFTNQKTPRSVSIRPSNIAEYQRDSDSDLVEVWLTKRGFTLNQRIPSHEISAPLLANA